MRLEGKGVPKINAKGQRGTQFVTVKVSLYTPHTNHHTPNTTPQTLNTTPQTPNPKHHTQTPKHHTPKPQTLNSVNPRPTS
jgi:DnaJ-class molecular chaperone